MEKTSEPTLGGYVSAVLRRWVIVVLGGLLGVLAGAGYLAVTPALHVATSEVNVNVITADPFNTARAASGLLDTPGEARLAGSYAVAARVAASTPGQDARDIQSRISVVGAQDSPTLRISAVGDSPAAARRLADAVAEEYLAYRSGQAQERIDRTVERSRERLQELRTSLQEATDRLATSEPSSTDALQAEVDRSLINLEISSLLNELVAAEGIDTTGGSVINPASTAQTDRQPPPVLVLATGLLAGIVFGLVAALIRDGLDPRVRSRHDLSVPGGAAFAVELPGRQDSLPPGQGDLQQLLVLREALLGRASVSPGHGVISIIDLTGSSGSRSVPFAVGMVFARAGLPVRLVELLGSPQEDLEWFPYNDLQLHEDAEPSDYRSFEVGAASGLRLAKPTESGRAEAQEVFPAGLQELVSAERHEALVVLSLPVGSSAATQLASLRVSDATVVVAAERVTDREQFQQVLTDARSFGVPTVGTVRVDRGRKEAPPQGSSRRSRRRGTERTGRPTPRLAGRGASSVAGPRPVLGDTGPESS